MAKKWAISDGPPLKVRLAGAKECDQMDGRVVERPKRVRAIGKRIVKLLITLWVLSIGAWIHSGDRGYQPSADADGPQDAIDGQDNPFGII